VTYSDSGGKVPAARAPVRGRLNVARFFLGITRKAPPDAVIEHARVNGQPGLVVSIAGQPVTVLSLDVVGEQIVACYAIRNPDKLARVFSD
jgi:RNA polymerase sigma-70 factor (ECF subfamily)